MLRFSDVTSFFRRRKNARILGDFYVLAEAFTPNPALVATLPHIPLLHVFYKTI